MPIPTPSTSNNGNTYFNKNACQSFTQTIGTALVALSAFPCSEVQFFIPPSSTVLKLYDNNDSINFLTVSQTTANPYDFSFMGITNSSTVSAQTSVGSITISYRTKYYTGAMLTPS